MLKKSLLLSFALAATASAADYDVQIGAFRDANAARLPVPAGVGELRTTVAPDGLTRALVGPFASRADAERARSELKAAGYSGAFIRKANVAGGQAVARPVETPATYRPEATQAESDSGLPSQKDLELLSSLSEEERRSVVYLDGRLHKKVGDEFIPLPE